MDSLFKANEVEKLQDMEVKPILRRIEDGTYKAKFGAPTYREEQNAIVLHLHIELDEKYYIISQYFNMYYRMEAFAELMSRFGIYLSSSSNFNMQALKPLIGQKVMIQTENYEKDDRIYTNIISFESLEEGEENWDI